MTTRAERNDRGQVVHMRFARGGDARFGTGAVRRAGSLVGPGTDLRPPLVPHRLVEVVRGHGGVGLGRFVGRRDRPDRGGGGIDILGQGVHVLLDGGSPLVDVLLQLGLALRRCVPLFQRRQVLLLLDQGRVESGTGGRTKRQRHGLPGAIGVGQRESRPHEGSGPRGARVEGPMQGERHI